VFLSDEWFLVWAELTKDCVSCEWDCGGSMKVMVILMVMVDR
jgi:hypothetical protein